MPLIPMGRFWLRATGHRNAATPIWPAFLDVAYDSAPPLKLELPVRRSISRWVSLTGTARKSLRATRTFPRAVGYSADGVPSERSSDASDIAIVVAHNAQVTAPLAILNDEQHLGSISVGIAHSTQAPGRALQYFSRLSSSSSTQQIPESL